MTMRRRDHKPSIADMPPDEAVAYLTRVYGESEASARFMVGMPRRRASTSSGLSS